ncbi:uncharacterized protein LOC112083469 [Eutrema salsugineum]|uniref:uncharacterized protein LOC112083469 n=1 Tax=Eutrema salsugineum TaxID=72664 RepID=UPI000CED304E|nr:uncharacterized protein LOC112083469 [Eutrema salsugineum]
MEVLKMEPFHFDYWMLSLVRWAPAVNPTYPSEIMFWVRIVGVLLHFWADVTFESIGKALGDVKKVNLDEGNVQIVIDGLQPLCFETMVEFQGGVKTTVYLRYERLFCFYKICHSLCHDEQRFPSRPDSTERKVREDYNDEHRNGQGAASNKAATVHGNVGNKENVKNGSSSGSYSGQNKGKGKVYEEDTRQYRSRGGKKNGEGVFRLNRPSGYLPPKEMNQRGSAISPVARKSGQQEVSAKLSVTEEIMVKTTHGEADMVQHVVENLKEDGEKGKQQEIEVMKKVGMVEKSVRKGISFQGDGMISHESVVTNIEKNEELILQDIGNNISMTDEEIVTVEKDKVEEGLIQEEGEILKSTEVMGTRVIEDLSHTDVMAVETSEMVKETEPVKNSKPATKKKQPKVSPQYHGALSKKRMIQNLVSPRKKQVTKITTWENDGSASGAPKGPSISTGEHQSSSTG